MKMVDALNILGITGDNITLEQCTLAYRRACMQYHPDRNPGGLEMMKAVNCAWDYLQTLDWNRPVINNESADAQYGEQLSAFINAIVILPGIVLEVCGAWVWVSGDTRPHKEAIKQAGGRWASKKKQWYFRPSEWKSSKKSGEWDMDKIRETYGSGEVRARHRPLLEE